MRRRLHSCLLVLALWGLGTGPSFAADPTETEVDAGGRPGTLLVPAGSGPFPAVVLIAGSGVPDRDGNAPPTIHANSQKLLAEALAERGIASLRYDKIFSGKARLADLATIREEDLTFDRVVADAAKAVQWLAQQPRIGRIVVVGHSEGAMAAPFVARRVDVAGLVLLASPGRPMAEVLKQQLRRNSANTPQVLAEGDGIIASLAAGERVPADKVPPYYLSLFRPSVQPYLISWLSIDTAAEILKAKQPFLIVMGGRDVQVTAEDVEAFRRAVPSDRLRVLATMNHPLKDVSEAQSDNMAAYSDPSRPLAAGLVDAVADFVTQVAR